MSPTVPCHVAKSIFLISLQSRYIPNEDYGSDDDTLGLKIEPSNGAHLRTESRPSGDQQSPLMHNRIHMCHIQ